MTHVTVTVHAPRALNKLPKIPPKFRAIVFDTLYALLFCALIPPILAFLYYHRPHYQPASRTTAQHRPLFAKPALPTIQPRPTFASRKRSPTQAQSQPKGKPALHHNVPAAPARRLTISESGNVAACYPSYGGVLAKNVSPLEIEWLNLPEGKHVDRALYQDDEDEFCDALERLGAGWFAPAFYPAEGDWYDNVGRSSPGTLRVAKYAHDGVTSSKSVEEGDVYSVYGGKFLDTAVPQVRGFEVAWPDFGGACVWNAPMIARKAEVEEWSGDWEDEARASMENSMSQEERCDAVLRWGGKYCASKAACPRAGRLFGIPLGESRVCATGREMVGAKKRHLGGRGREAGHGARSAGYDAGYGGSSTGGRGRRGGYGRQQDNYGRQQESYGRQRDTYAREEEPAPPSYEEYVQAYGRQQETYAREEEPAPPAYEERADPYEEKKPSWQSKKAAWQERAHERTQGWRDTAKEWEETAERWQEKKAQGRQPKKGTGRVRGGTIW